jgi:hypothetical protein
MGKVTSHIMSKDMIDSKNKAMVDMQNYSRKAHKVQKEAPFYINQMQEI